MTTDRGRVRCSPASGSLFAIGTTRVRCTATAGPRHASGAFDVIVVDGTPPVLALPPSIDRQVGESGGVVTYDASALDIVDGRLTPSCEPGSGSRLALGTTAVHCSVTDAHGNRASGSFLVRLTKGSSNGPKPQPQPQPGPQVHPQPQPGPQVHPQPQPGPQPQPEPQPQLRLRLPGDLVREATGPGGAAVTFEVSASGESAEQAAVRCTPASGSLFHLGATRSPAMRRLPAAPRRTAASTSSCATRPARS